MRSILKHLADYTPAQIKKLEKQWEKEKAVAIIQGMMKDLPVDTPKDRLVWIKFFEMWGRMSGVFIPETVTQTTNNILVIPETESDELWKQRIKHQQAAAFDDAATEMATDTGATVVSS